MNVYLIKRQQIAEMDSMPKVHFLNENAVRMTKSLGDVTGITGFGFHIVEVEPGRETTEYHFHHYEDECVYILSGTATAMIGDAQFSIGPGDFLGYRKGGLPHSIKNTGCEVLRYIVAGERLSHDVCDYPHLNKRLFRHSGLAKSLVEIPVETK